MPDKAIVDASPIIFLANAGLLDFLRSAAAEVLLPVAVADEIRKGSETELAVIAIESSEWLRVVETPDVSPLVQTWDLGPGESAVLSYARAHPGTVADLAGRRCAEALGIPVTEHSCSWESKTRTTYHGFCCPLPTAKFGSRATYHEPRTVLPTANCQLASGI